jgi:hypothetical protein
MTGNALAATTKPAATRAGRKPAAKKAGKRKSTKTTNPSRTKTPMGQGIYIPSSRVKRYLDAAGLNKRIEDAISELRDAEPHDVEKVAYVKNEATNKLKKVVTGTHRTELISFNQLSEATRNMIAEAKTADDEREKARLKAEKALADRLKAMSAEERKRYDDKQAKTEADEAAKVAASKAKAAQLAEDIKAGKVDAKKHPVRGPKKETKYGGEIELLSKMRIRFSKDASQQLAATICAMVHERTKFSIENCLSHDLKIVKVRHAVTKFTNKLSKTEDPDLLPFASLIRNLPIYRQAIADEEQRVVDELKLKEEKQVAKEAARKLAKEAAAAAARKLAEATLEETAAAAAAAAAAAIATAAAAKAAVDAAKDGVAAPVKEVMKAKTVEEVKAKVVEDDEDDEDDEASFGHYVRQVAHNVMNVELQNFVAKDKHPYEDIRISAEYREWMSEVIIEFIRRFCPLLNGQIRTMGIKTISRDIIRQTVNIHLEIYGVDTVASNALFDQKFDLYQAYSEKRKLEKAAEKKVADEAKKAAAAAGQPAAAEDAETETETDSEGEESEAEEEAAPVVAAPAAPRRKPAHA